MFRKKLNPLDLALVTITPQMPFPSILVLAEGMMERFFIDRNFYYVELVEIKNGSSWSSERMADQVASKFYTKNMNPDLTIVWLDREKNDSNAEQLSEAILAKMTERGADPRRVCICIPDRMTENMILADELVIRERFSDPEYMYSYEGKNGKHVLSELFKGKGINYKETTHGAELLRKVRLKRAAAKNAAAEKLLAAITFPCWWVGEESYGIVS